jgi:signal transduction histidine kinase
MNLATNATRHTRTKVSFELVARDDYAYLSVSDDGPGVPPAEREHVFERFVRLDGARAHQSGGVGLGLAIVREIAGAHDGVVWIEDATPGARFVVRLPRVVSPADESEAGLSRTDDRGDTALHFSAATHSGEAAEVERVEGVEATSS